jgi:ribosomal protein S18 acetylase RimI-like enzyme
MNPSGHDSSPVAAERRFRGEECVLRALGPGDAVRLRDFFYSHTEETIRSRYGCAVVRMTYERALELVSVDQQRDVALGIFACDAEGNEIIHAIGRYCLDADGHGAEVALVVRESRRRCGMGRCLLQALITTARARGLAYVWGRVRHDNVPMLDLFREFGGATMPAEDPAETDWIVRVPLINPAPKRVRTSGTRIRRRRSA